MTLLSMNEVGEFGGISQKEDGSVVSHNIPVALSSPQFDSETSWVSSQIMRARLATDGGETNGEWAFLALLTEEIGRAEIV